MAESDCPGGPADLLGPGVGRCRYCDYVFPTVMDEPTLPPHRTRGDITTFSPHGNVIDYGPQFGEDDDG